MLRDVWPNSIGVICGNKLCLNLKAMEGCHFRLYGITQQ